MKKETQLLSMALFFSLSLIAGMNMSPVSRLKKTWSKVKTAKFFILEVKKKKIPGALQLYSEHFCLGVLHRYPGVRCLETHFTGRGPDSKLKYPRCSEEDVKLLICRGNSKYSNK